MNEVKKQQKVSTYEMMQKIMTWIEIEKVSSHFGKVQSTA